MLVEFGNNAAPNGVDDRPKVTTVHVPEFDDGSTHDDAVYNVGGQETRLGDMPDRQVPEDATLVTAGPQLGGYTHVPGAISVPDFKAHRQEALDFRNGITRLPDHEILQAIVNAWPAMSQDRPTWVSVRSHRELTGQQLGHAPEVAKDIQGFLQEFYGLPESATKPADVEFTHWTRFGAPGQGEPVNPLPDITALYTDAGRVISNINDGGGQVGAIGAGTAATATGLTTASTFTTNQWAGYRVVVYSTTSNNMVWGNVLSNTNAAGASVLTVDRWYVAATPGGSAGTTPTTPWAFMILDGGSVSSWFVGLTSTNITPAHGDTSMSGEITTAGGGLVRRIAPYAQTSGVASRSLTLTPVFAANGSDTLPVTVYAIGVFVSMVVASTPLCMKFETSLNASATLNTSGDTVTVTETITGS